MHESKVTNARSGSSDPARQKITKAFRSLRCNAAAMPQSESGSEAQCSGSLDCTGVMTRRPESNSGTAAKESLALSTLNVRSRHRLLSGAARRRSARSRPTPARRLTDHASACESSPPACSTRQSGQESIRGRPDSIHQQCFHIGLQFAQRRIRRRNLLPRVKTKQRFGCAAGPG